MFGPRSQVLTIIEQHCAVALNRRASEDEVMVNIDLLTPKVTSQDVESYRT